MSQQIHRSWLQPVPSYWLDWAWRDDPRLDPDAPLPSSTEPEVCVVCKLAIEPSGNPGSYRTACDDPACRRERKRRNNRASLARRKAMA